MYKIVKVVDGKRLSCAAPPSATLEYSKGKVTCRREGFGPLAVFRTYKHAIDFLWKNGWLNGWSIRREIWSCDVLDPSEDCIMWTKSHELCLLPKGTELVDRITLNKRIMTVGGE